jgi:hypothetical protein
MALTLVWVRCEGNAWCPLLTVNLNHAHFNSLEPREDPRRLACARRGRSAWG